jgi:hypothetical protein
MAKTCPHCGYTAIGPFIDNCPICAEPVRSVRSDGFGFHRSPSLSMVLRVVGGVAAVMVLGIVGCCGVGMWQMGRAVQDAQMQAQQFMAQQAAERQARTVAVAAADLLREFAKDSAAADRKYAAKYLEITGVVEKSGHERYERPFVILTGGDESAKLKIECFFDFANPQEQARIKRLDKGESITVCGEYHGQVSNVQVRECRLVRSRSPAPKDDAPKQGDF